MPSKGIDSSTSELVMKAGKTFKEKKIVLRHESKYYSAHLRQVSPMMKAVVYPFSPEQTGVLKHLGFSINSGGLMSGSNIIGSSLVNTVSWHKHLIILPPRTELTENENIIAGLTPAFLNAFYLIEKQPNQLMFWSYCWIADFSMLPMLLLPYLHQSDF